VKKSGFTEEQIAFAVKQAEVWTKVEDMCGKMGIGLKAISILPGL